MTPEEISRQAAEFRAKHPEVAKRKAEMDAERKKESKEEKVFTSFYALEAEKVICEQIYDKKKNLSSFACWDGEHLTYAPSLINGFILPIADKEVRDGCVLLASEATEFGSLLDLTNEIYLHIEKYLDVSESFAKFCTWYVILTWLYDRCFTVPYLRALGDYGTGKSRFLSVIGGISYKGIVVAGAVGSAPIFRLINKWHGTLILEEADFDKSDEKAALIKILNCGFERGKPVVRCSQENYDDLKFFDTFCPKLLATRKDFQDLALESRCLTEKMRQTQRRNIPRVLTREFYEAQQVIRNKLLMFRLKNYHSFEQKESVLDSLDIEPRLQQSNEAMAAIFQYFPDVFEAFKSFLLEYQTEQIQKRAESFDGQIVITLFELYDESPEGIVTTSEIAEKLDSKAQTIGKRLGALGVKTKTYRQSGKVIRIIDVSNETLAYLRKRYGIEASVTAVTGVTAVTQAQNVTTVTNVTGVTKEPHRTNISGVCALCGQTTILTILTLDGFKVCSTCGANQQTTKEPSSAELAEWNAPELIKGVK